MDTDTLQEDIVVLDDDQPTGTRRLGRSPSLTVLGAALAVLVVAGLALSLFEWTTANAKVGRLQTLQSLRAGATKAADSYAVAFGSYDYHDLHGANAPWTVIEDHSTARFRSDYQRTSSALEQTIVAYKASAKATVPASAVSSISTSKAVVLLQLDQVITNSTQKGGPQSQQFIVVMTLQRDRGHWLIDNVQASA